MKTVQSDSHDWWNKRFLDEKPVPGKPDDSYDSVTRKYSYNLQPEVNELLHEFRKVLDEYTNKDGLERVMMTEGRVVSFACWIFKRVIFLQNVLLNYFLKVFWRILLKMCKTFMRSSFNQLSQIVLATHIEFDYSRASLVSYLIKR